VQKQVVEGKDPLILFIKNVKTVTLLYSTCELFFPFIFLNSCPIAVPNEKI